MRLARISVAGVAVEADRAERARDVGDAAEEALSAQRAEVMLARAAAAAEGGGPLERAWHLTGQADLDRARGGGNAEPWRRAAEAWDAIERIPVGAHCRWRQAEAHLAGGEPEAAAAAARSALAVARRIGAAWLVGELEGLAARARLDLDADPRRADAAPPPDDPFGLTPRERQVLALVAEGATNREIGSRLYMAEKTASVHVSRILAKLDVRTRTQAAAVAHRFRLEDTASR
jgi:DNA-binding CsgD family transcriptional regulator